jgi:hypothetical protein
MQSRPQDNLKIIECKKIYMDYQTLEEHIILLTETIY